MGGRAIDQFVVPEMKKVRQRGCLFLEPPVDRVLPDYAVGNLSHEAMSQIRVGVAFL